MQTVTLKPVIPAPRTTPEARPGTHATRPRTVPGTPHEQRDIRVGAVRLRYIDVGPTERDGYNGALLLIHGHTSRIEEYDAIVPHLARRHRVLVPDLPGCGYSDKPDAPYSLALYEDTLLAFLDALRVERAHLAGGSLGGNLVLRLGHREPTRFPRLAAWAPAGVWDPYPRIGAFVRSLQPSALFWPMVWAQSRFWYEPSWPGRRQALAETFKYYREVFTPGFARMYWEIGCDQMEQSLFHRAPAITQPTLLLWGDRDHGMNLGVGVKRLHALLPRARLHVFPGARHSLAQEVPALLSREVDDFLVSALER